MSLSIRALSKPKLVACNRYVDEEREQTCEHDEVAWYPERRDGLKPG
jgi:hypothetical protein